jgi:Fur family ferric uptake transcriptional regulator
MQPQFFLGCDGEHCARTVEVIYSAQARHGRDLMSNGTLDISLEEICVQKGMRMTDQRRVIARVLSDADDHPDVEEVYRRASAIDGNISIATVYRTVRLFDDAGILERHEFRDGRARYEPAPEEHHDHLIDLQSGKVIEFRNEDIEKLQEFVARELGYKLVDHRLELYGTRIKSGDGNT